MTTKLKTPISYYGGKQTMLKHILPLVPAHGSYTEAFAGGLALLFAKSLHYLKLSTTLMAS